MAAHCAVALFAPHPPHVRRCGCQPQQHTYKDLSSSISSAWQVFGQQHPAGSGINAREPCCSGDCSAGSWRHYHRIPLGASVTAPSAAACAYSSRGAHAPDSRGAADGRRFQTQRACRCQRDKPGCQVGFRLSCMGTYRVSSGRMLLLTAGKGSAIGGMT